eukprot:jgi/Chlat1/7416/Chrsp6S07437
MTAAVYGQIKEGNYQEAIRILEPAASSGGFARSRAVLSLLAYCYYHAQLFPLAAQTYERLVRACPEVDDYRLYYAQALFKASMR